MARHVPFTLASWLFLLKACPVIAALKRVSLLRIHCLNLFILTINAPGPFRRCRGREAVSDNAKAVFPGHPIYLSIVALTCHAHLELLPCGTVPRLHVSEHFLWGSAIWIASDVAGWSDDAYCLALPSNRRTTPGFKQTAADLLLLFCSPFCVFISAITFAQAGILGGGLPSSELFPRQFVVQL